MLAMHVMSSSQLPAELLLRIIELATFVRGETDDLPDPAEGPPLPPAFENEQQLVLIQTMEIRRSLCLVSRLWRRLARPLLYQTLQITSWRELNLAAAYYQRSKIDDGKLAQVGKWTKRFQLKLEDVVTPSNLGPWEELAQLIRCMPNLKIFSSRVTVRPEAFDGYRPQTGLPSLLVDALVETCSGSLQMFEQYRGFQKARTAFLPSLADLSRLFDNCGRLRTLRAHYVSASTGSVPSPTLSLVASPKLLASVESLDYPSSLWLAVNNGVTLPRLRHLRIYIYQGAMGKLNEFLTQHGRNLRTIEWNDSDPFRFRFDVRNPLFDTCRELKWITLRLKTTTDLPRIIQCIPCSKLQGVEIHTDIRKSVGDIELGLRYLLEHPLPAFKIIRFGSPGALKDLQESVADRDVRDSFGTLFEAFTARGIFIEDSEGNRWIWK